MGTERESTDEMVALAEKTWRRKPARSADVPKTQYDELLSDAKRLAGSVIAQAKTKGDSPK